MGWLSLSLYLKLFLCCLYCLLHLCPFFSASISLSLTLSCLSLIALALFSSCARDDLVMGDYDNTDVDPRAR